MTVGRMREEMSNDEYVRWTVYHARKAQRQELNQKLEAARAKRKR